MVQKVVYTMQNELEKGGDGVQLSDLEVAAGRLFAIVSGICVIEAISRAVCKVAVCARVEIGDSKGNVEGSGRRLSGYEENSLRKLASREPRNPFKKYEWGGGKMNPW